MVCQFSSLVTRKGNSCLLRGKMYHNFYVWVKNDIDSVMDSRLLRFLFDFGMCHVTVKNQQFNEIFLVKTKQMFKVVNTPWKHSSIIWIFWIKPRNKMVKSLFLECKTMSMMVVACEHIPRDNREREREWSRIIKLQRLEFDN